MRLFRFFIRNPLHELASPPKGQVPALDALRSGAILMVIFCHAAGAHTSGSAANLFAALPFVRGGWLGVDLFFVLSGYLIGKQLWREFHKTGTIHLGQFMLRRGLRIWPLYFAVFAFVLLLQGTGRLTLDRGWPDLLFLSNYFPGGVVPGGWSLSTEEQFYLFAPLLILLGVWFSRSLTWFRWPLLACLLLLPVLRALTQWGVLDLLSGFSDPFAQIHRPIHTHADGLLMGLLLANFAADGKGPDPRSNAPTWALVTSAVLFASTYVIQRQVLLFSGAALFFGCLTWFLLARPQLSSKLFGFRPFYLVSRLSYGMYLNHLLLLKGVLAVGLALPLASLSPSLHSAGVALTLTAVSLAVACVSYCLIEHPFLRLRDRLLSKSTSRVVAQGRQRQGQPAPLEVEGDVHILIHRVDIILASAEGDGGDLVTHQPVGVQPAVGDAQDRLNSHLLDRGTGLANYRGVVAEAERVIVQP
jgi:peptidoglycan/LPS O-acetylase OafA/YrhL